jgi:hypothetical protein
MFNDAGITIYAYKPDQALTPKSTDAEINFAMRAAKALGAKSVTLELPESLEHSKRLGELGAKNQVYVGYHAHTQATDTLWDASIGTISLQLHQLRLRTLYRSWWSQHKRNFNCVY